MINLFTYKNYYQKYANQQDLITGSYSLFECVLNCITNWGKAPSHVKTAGIYIVIGQNIGADIDYSKRDPYRYGMNGVYAGIVYKDVHIYGFEIESYYFSEYDLVTDTTKKAALLDVFTDKIIYNLKLKGYNIFQCYKYIKANQAIHRGGKIEVNGIVTDTSTFIWGNEKGLANIISLAVENKSYIPKMPSNKKQL